MQPRNGLGEKGEKMFYGEVRFGGENLFQGSSRSLNTDLTVCDTQLDRSGASSMISSIQYSSHWSATCLSGHIRFDSRTPNPRLLASRAACIASLRLERYIAFTTSAGG